MQKISVSNKGTHFYITWDGSALTLWHTYTRRTIVTDLEGCGKKNTNALSIQHTHTAHILPTHDTTPTVTPDPLSCFLQTVYDKAVRYSAVSETGLHNHKDTAKGYHSQLSNLFTICIFLGTFDCCIAYIAHQFTFTCMHLADIAYTALKVHILSVLAGPRNRTHDVGVASSVLYW